MTTSCVNNLSVAINPAPINSAPKVKITNWLGQLIPEIEATANARGPSRIVARRAQVPLRGRAFPRLNKALLPFLWTATVGMIIWAQSHVSPRAAGHRPLLAPDRRPVYGYITDVCQNVTEHCARVDTDREASRGSAAPGPVSDAAEAASWAAVAGVTNASSTPTRPCQRQSTWSSAPLLARGTGTMSATRRPPRVTTIVSPCSASSNSREPPGGLGRRHLAHTLRLAASGNQMAR